MNVKLYLKSKCRFLALLLALVLLLPSTISVFADNDGFKINLENLTQMQGVFTEQSNGLHGVGTGDCFAMSSTVMKNFIYEADVSLSGNSGAASLVFRSGGDPKNDGSYVANIDLQRGDARIFSFGTGGHDLGTYSLPDKSKRNFKMRVEVINNSIKYYLDGVLAISTTDTSYISGKLGVLVYSGDVVFQNLMATKIEDSEIPNLKGLKLVNADDSLYFDSSLDTYFARVDSSISSIKINAVANVNTDMKVNAYDKSGQVLSETLLLNNVDSGSIPVGADYTTVNIKLRNTKLNIEIIKTVKVKWSSAIIGDINCDNLLSQADIDMMEEAVFDNITLNSRQLSNGDVNKDKKITVADIIKLKVIILDNNRGGKMIKYTDVVNRMTDMEQLAEPADLNETCSESSAYNKLSKYNVSTGHYENWGQNYDEGKDAPRSSDGGYILADIKGPGSIVRIWSADPRQGHIKIFIDGNLNPVIDMPFIDLFGCAQAPFNLSELTYDASRGKNCYIPITYNKSCKVIVYDDWGMFYQVNYISFSPDTNVEPFEYPLTSKQLEALYKVNDQFSSGMGETNKTYTDKNVTSKTVTVQANKSLDILNSSTSGAVTGIKIKINGIKKDGDDWSALSDMTVSAFWDNDENPSVFTTLGGFFASTTGLNEYESLPMGVKQDGTMYNTWYMPYDSSAKITITNDSSKDYSITYEVTTVPLEKSKAEKLLRFHAKWVRAKDPPKGEMWPDSQFLYVTGKGRYVGTSLHVYKAIGTGDPSYEPNWWWGEGDEKFFVDGEKFPSWFGTGSEDYFGYAWGTWKPFHKAYHSQPFTNGGMFGIGNRLNNRFHIIDSVPFNSSFNANLEKYHRDNYSNFVFTSYWYLDKNGNDPYKPVSLQERTEYYESPFPDASVFYEGENLKIIESTGMLKAETQDMTPFNGNWSNNSQFIFKSEGIGNYVKFRIKVAEDGNYNLTARFTKAPDFGIVQHFIDSKPIGTVVDLYGNSVALSNDTPLGAVYLTAGYHDFEVRITGKNSLSSGYLYGLDYLKINKVS